MHLTGVCLALRCPCMSTCTLERTFVQSRAGRIPIHAEMGLEAVHVHVHSMQHTSISQ